ncbi:hypothetical protein LZ32DRAFT_54313 [Colletotrichum eremochloae]|nr:hypothetical protein LZ32DRAFT_54313 [Colletotrichum eremochloae]
MPIRHLVARQAGHCKVCMFGIIRRPSSPRGVGGQYAERPGGSHRRGNGQSVPIEGQKRGTSRARSRGRLEPVWMDGIRTSFRWHVNKPSPLPFRAAATLPLLAVQEQTSKRQRPTLFQRSFARPSRAWRKGVYVCVCVWVGVPALRRPRSSIEMPGPCHPRGKKKKKK